MRKNLEKLGGLIHSQRVLLALTAKRLSREDAYAMVQRNAMPVWRGEGDFRTLLGQDKDVSAKLSATELDALFDLSYHFKHVDTISRASLERLSAAANLNISELQFSREGDERRGEEGHRQGEQQPCAILVAHMKVSRPEADDDENARHDAARHAPVDRVMHQQAALFEDRQFSFQIDLRRAVAVSLDDGSRTIDDAVQS